jgi:uncharacterized membrane protein YphA (DoxX/SURF4 family)
MIPERFGPQVYSIFRAVFGFLFLFHGLQKMFGMFGGQAVPLSSLLGAAGIIFHCERRDGGRLFHGALPEGAVAHREWW